jgi:hypothetical protein
MIVFYDQLAETAASRLSLLRNSCFCFVYAQVKTNTCFAGACFPAEHTKSPEACKNSRAKGSNHKNSSMIIGVNIGRRKHRPLKVPGS